MESSATTATTIILGSFALISYLAVAGWLIARRLGDDLLTLATLHVRQARVEHLQQLDGERAIARAEFELSRFYTLPGCRDTKCLQLFAQADELTQDAITARSAGSTVAADTLFAAARRLHDEAYALAAPSILTQTVAA